MRAIRFGRPCPVLRRPLCSGICDLCRPVGLRRMSLRIRPRRPPAGRPKTKGSAAANSIFARSCPSAHPHPHPSIRRSPAHPSIRIGETSPPSKFAIGGSKCLFAARRRPTAQSADIRERRADPKRLPPLAARGRWFVKSRDHDADALCVLIRRRLKALELSAWAPARA